MKFSRRSLLLVGAALAGPGALSACAEEKADIQQVDAAYVKAGLANGSVTLIDVREPDEWAAGHIAGATLAPLSSFDPKKLPAAQPGKSIVIMCRSGNRSRTAIALAQKAGRSDVRLNFDGSMRAWMAAGGPVAR